MELPFSLGGRLRLTDIDEISLGFSNFSNKFAKGSWPSFRLKGPGNLIVSDFGGIFTGILWCLSRIFKVAHP